MACVAVKAREAVVDVSLFVPALDVTAYSETELDDALAQARKAQRCLDGYVLRLGSRAKRLAAKGQSAPADETLRGHGTSGVGCKQARSEAKQSETTDALPGLGEALSHGETSSDHVDAVTRHLGKLSEQQRSEIDVDALVEKAKSLPPETFNVHMKRLVDQITEDYGLADTKTKQAASEFRHWFDRKSGMGRFTGQLDPERYEALTNCIDQHVASLAAASDGTVTKSHNLAAEALVQLTTTFGGRDARSRLPSVTLVVDHDTIVHGAHGDSVHQTEHGHDVPPETIARLCCDATIRRVTLDKRGVPINVGRKYRTATDAQWAAIKTLHETCAWDGCAAPINWCQAHHIREWDNGGPTDLGNLIPLCSQHHHRVHEGQWHIKLLPNRTLEIRKPNGSHYTTTTTPKRE